MSTYNQQKHSILDAPSGHIGPVIFYSWKGIGCVRSMPQHYHDARTINQLQNRSKLSVLMAFQSKMKPAIMNGYKHSVNHTSELNEATRINFRTALTVQGSTAFMDYSNAYLSWGNLPRLSNLQYLVLNNQLLIHWDSQSSPDPNDQVFLALYNETRHTAQFHPHSATRQSQGVLIPIPHSWQHDQIHVWIWLNGNTQNSVSQYLGTLSQNTQNQQTDKQQSQQPTPKPSPDSKAPKCYQTPHSLGSDTDISLVSDTPSSPPKHTFSPPKG